MAVLPSKSQSQDNSSPTPNVLAVERLDATTLMAFTKARHSAATLRAPRLNHLVRYQIAPHYCEHAEGQTVEGREKGDRPCGSLAAIMSALHPLCTVQHTICSPVPVLDVDDQNRSPIDGSTKSPMSLVAPNAGDTRRGSARGKRPRSLCGTFGCTKPDGHTGCAPNPSLSILP